MPVDTALAPATLWAAAMAKMPNSRGTNHCTAIRRGGEIFATDPERLFYYSGPAVGCARQQRDATQPRVARLARLRECRE